MPWVSDSLLGGGAAGMGLALATPHNQAAGILGGAGAVAFTIGLGMRMGGIGQKTGF